MAHLAHLRLVLLFLLLAPITAAAQVAQVITSTARPNHVVTITRDDAAQLTALVSRPGFSTVSIILPTKDANFTDVVFYQQDQAVLFASYSPQLVYVLDLSSSTVIDHFLAERVSVSPSGKYLAYTRVVGRLDNEDNGAVYLLYDLTKNPEANRMAGASSTGAKESVGIAIFPEWNRDGRSYTVKASNPGGLTLQKSPIVWISDDGVVFLHQQANKISAVAVENVGSASLARTSELNLKELVDGPANAAAAGRVVATSVIPLSVGNHVCRVRFVFPSGLKLSSLEVAW